MANKPTIEQMNRDLAIFMELIPVPAGTKRLGDIKHPEVSEAFLNYHRSWDELMPVVEKIEGMEWCVRVENWPKKFNSPYKELYSVWMWLDPEDCPEIQTYSDSKIEAVHKAVYQFITWYSQQKQTNAESKI